MSAMPCPNRIEAIRQRYLDHGGFRGDPEGWLFGMRGWLQSAGATSLIVRRAQAKALMLRSITPAIDDGELVVGKPLWRQLTADEQAEADTYRSIAAKAMPRDAGQRAHMAIDFVKLLRCGVEGVLDEVEQRRAALDLTCPENTLRNEFYLACAEVLNSVMDCSDRYAAHAEDLAGRCDNAHRAEELRRIACVCRTVPRKPAHSFYEAVQSVHFVNFCLKSATFMLGRPDRYLLDFYQRDIAAGTLTPEFAQELLDCLCMQFNERAGKGTSLGLMIGGRDAEGRDVSNELTEMFLETIPHTRLSYPSIGLCCSAATPPRLLRRACEILAMGCTHPALFNDEVITRGLRAQGLNPAEACEYIHSSCVEITPIASSGVWVASPYHNLPQYLLDVMDLPLTTAGTCGPSQARLSVKPAAVASPDPDDASDPTDVSSFEDLITRYRRHLANRVREEAIFQNRLQAERARIESEDILAACFVNDCLERGRSIDAGGARYNWIMPSFVGLANLADSLIAVRRLVFEQKKLSLTEFASILQTNFQANEDLRREIIGGLPQYGNDLEEPDALVREIVQWIAEEVGRYRTWRGGRFLPSLFCWVMHERLGAQTGATPDGRLAGQALGDGSGAAQGRDRRGPTAALLSATKWDHTPFIGGIAVNLKFSKKSCAGAALDKMVALIQTFLARGGFEIQVNVVDRETLLHARAHPEAHRDLVVRIGGYSDYFTSLSPAMQDEIIQRAEHELA
mgnify:CR=1 FL=1